MRAACRKDGRLGERGGLIPDTPQRGTRRPPPGTFVPPPQRAKQARSSARSGISDGSPLPHPPRPRQTGSRPRPPAPETGSRGRKSARPRTPLMEARGTPRRAPLCRPQAAPSQLAKACAVWLLTGPLAHTPRPDGERAAELGRLLQGRAVGEGECPTLDTPHGGKRRPHRASSCNPHGAQRQLARACAVGSVTGFQARSPDVKGKQAAGPGRTPQRGAVVEGRVPGPAHPLQRHESPPSARPWAAPKARKASLQERALWGP